jgi:hypothetical protein
VITAKNYAAQAELGLRRWAKLVKGTYENWQVDSFIAEQLANDIGNAVHFALPDGGKLLDDEWKGLQEQEIRLPYKCITIEYFVKESEESTSAFAVSDVPKRLLFATEVDMSTFEKPGMEKIKRYYERFEQENMIQMWVVNCREKKSKNWFPMPLSVVIPRKFENLGKNIVRSAPVISFPGLYKETERRYGEKYAREASVHDVGPEMHALLNMIEALTCSNIETETIEEIDERKNNRRMKSGKLPIYETKRLVLKVPKSTTARGNCIRSDRSSPRQHLRRGHIRRIFGDRRIWVNSCVVGDATKGIVQKDYALVQ